MEAKLELDPASEKALNSLMSRVEGELQQVAQQAQADAQTMAVLGAETGIYATASGKYKRTGHYLDSIRAVAAVQGPVITVLVQDSAEYASHLEYGTVSPLDSLTAQKLAEALGVRPEVLYLGRTGVNYGVANPTITRATLYAAHRAIDRLTKFVATI